MVAPSEGHGCNKWSTRAKEKENQYDWVGAANDYRKSVRTHLASKDFSRAGEALERVGLCFERAAFQAMTSEDFQARIESAVRAYQHGVEILGKMRGRQRDARICICRAKRTYVKSWIKKEVTVKRELLHACSVHAKKALDVYKRIGDQEGFARVCNDLVVYLDNRLRIASTKSAVEELLSEADSYCERAIEASSTLHDKYELARAYYNSGHHFLVSVFLRPLNEKTEENRQKALGHLRRAIRLFRKMNEAYLSVQASLDFALIAYCRMTMEPERGIEDLTRLSRLARNMKDNYILAWASVELAFYSWWMIKLEQDPEKKRQWYHKCIRYAGETIHHSSRVSDNYGVAFACFWHAYAKHAFAEELETNPSSRRLLLKESVNISRESVKYAKRSGVLEAIEFAKHVLCLSLFFFSQTDTDIDEKERALEEALQCGEEAMKIAEVGTPSDFWNIAVVEFFLSLILLKQAEMELDSDEGKALLERASLHRTNARQLALKYLALYSDRKRFLGLGALTSLYGESLYRLYQLTGKKHILHELFNVYSSSASMFSQIGLSNLVAQAQWQIARVLDLQGRFLEAARFFDRASLNFKVAAEETPLLEYCHMDSALYMSAWKEIEEAKFCGKTLKNSEGAEHYRRASAFLGETFKWRYLSPYYLALSQVELGEHLRKQNASEEAERMFDEAAMSFEQAETLLKGRQNFAESPEEREEISKLIRIAAMKRKSCGGQIGLEETKVLRTLPEYPERAAGLNAFDDACIRARITSPREFAVGRETEIGLDLVNIGRKPGVIVRIEKLAPASLSVLKMSPGYTLEGESLNIEGRLLGPLQTLSLRVKVRPVGFDAVELCPRVVYLNYHGEFVVYDVEPVLMKPVVTFESEPAHGVFLYLVDAFREDHVKRGMPVEESGRRTRPQIIRGVKGINKRHVYGAHGQLGPILLRLQNQGLVNIEVTMGKRSRGGRLARIRVAYENEAVKRYVAKEVISA